MLNQSYSISTVMWSYQVRYITGHHLKLVQIRNIFMKQAENLSTVMYLSLIKFTIPTLTLIATYSWIIIFTTLCSIKAEFRTINDVLDAWNKYFQRTLMNFFFTVKRNVLLIWRVICKFILGQLFLLWVILRIDLAHVPMNQYLLYIFLISQT